MAEDGDDAAGVASGDSGAASRTSTSADDDFAVVLLADARLATALASRLAAPVRPSTEADHLAVAATLSERADLVIGVAGVPWPVAESLHAQASASLPAYTGVVSWHALPSLHQRLADAVAPGVRNGAHLLITAPDPGPESDPSEVLFLREVAEGIADRVEPASRSIAWRGAARTPTALDALTSIVEVHGHRDIVECPVAPGMTADPELMAAARQLGARLICVDLGSSSRSDLLEEVVRTVAGHERAS